MSKELTAQDNNNNSSGALVVRPMIPTNIEEAWRLAKAFATAEMLPKSYTGDLEVRIAKAFTAMQLGAEVGMTPMQSIQSIAVVNGMPTIWGDAQKALVISHHSCVDVIETYEGTYPEDDFKAVCVSKRKGKADVTEEFSIGDAKKANLWNKSGPWQTNPKRMLKYRARSFSLRDQFPDVLKGLTHSQEEMVDVTPTSISQPRKQKEKRLAADVNQALAAQADGKQIIEGIAEVETVDNTVGAPGSHEAEGNHPAEKERPIVTYVKGQEIQLQFANGILQSFPKSIDTLAIMNILRDMSPSFKSEFVRDNIDVLPTLAEAMRQDNKKFAAQVIDDLLK